MTIEQILPLLTSVDLNDVKLGIEYAKQLSKLELIELRKQLNPIEQDKIPPTYNFRKDWVWSLDYEGEVFRNNLYL